jgi:alkylhydroperoxidase/carboxymuconolactone decarboxylase family protein YurZ
LNDINLISDAFQTFFKETPEYSRAWMEAVQKLDAVNVLDKKTKALAYLAVLSASGLISGIPFHVQHAKSLGASREEVMGAVLVGLPAVGHRVVQALPVALEAYDNK